MSVTEFIKHHQLEIMSVVGCDFHGYARGKNIAATKLLANNDFPMRLSTLFTMLDYGNYPIEPPAEDERWWPSWSSGYGDTRAVIDESTIRLVPWQNRTGLILCGFEHADGSGALDFLPREILKRLIRRCQDLHFSTRVALECEFTLFDETSRSASAKHYRNLQTLWPSPQAYLLTTLGKHDHVIRPLRDNLEAFGINIETWNVEAGPGQLEINLAPDHALAAADRGFLLKHAVKEICSSMNLLASFMAQPDSGGFANGNHVNISLWRDGRNAFYDESQPAKLSLIMRQFIAGVVQSLPDFTLMYAPNPNAYRRYKPYFWTGMNAAWGLDNKSVAVRAVNESPEKTRIEQRTGGADANPYLLISAVLAAGLYGIENRLEMPQAIQGDAYADDSVMPVCTNMHQALNRFENSQVTNAYLGEDFVRFYAHSRRAEAHLFDEASAALDEPQAVSDWELRRYFELV